MQSSDTIGAIAEALAKFQSTVQPITKGRTAKIPGKDGKSGYSYQYADLGDIIATTRSTLAECGLAVVQDVTSDGSLVLCATRVMHKSGEWFESGYYMLPAGGTPQTAGSAATYCRRYSYSAALGIVSEEDDDGAGATHGADATRTDTAIGSDAPIVRAIFGKKSALNMTDAKLKAAIARDYPGKEHPGDLTMVEAKQLADKMQKAIDKKAKEMTTAEVLAEQFPEATVTESDPHIGDDDIAF